MEANWTPIITVLLTIFGVIAKETSSPLRKTAISVLFVPFFCRAEISWPRLPNGNPPSDMISSFALRPAAPAAPPSRIFPAIGRYLGGSCKILIVSSSLTGLAVSSSVNSLIPLSVCR